jgi:putative OPT family oligopeptide transporter
MVGMVGSSNSPLSGLYFIAVIILSLFLKPLANAHIGHNFLVIVGIIILLVGSIGFAAVITNENIQDYKSGQMIGATPYKQQISLFIGVVCSVLFAPLMMNLILNAYGIAGVVPHAGIDPNQTLNAPQASSIAMITNNVLHSSQNWMLLLVGITVGAVTFILDLIGKRTGKFRLPVLMLGLGIYLSPDLVTTLFIGGLISMAISAKQKKLLPKIGNNSIESLNNRTHILICGLIAGESLMGLFLSVPFVISQNLNIFSLVGESFTVIASWLSLVITLGLIWLIYRSGTKTD